MSAPATTFDTTGIERLAHDLEHGPGSRPERTREFCRLFPGELATVRRQIHRHVGLLPVPVKGSAARGLRSGYFMTRLRDGTLGYLQRRTDDCLQAAIASCLQIPPHLVPDLHIEQQLAGGKDPEEMERWISQTMRLWLDEHGVTAEVGPSLPTSARRWIGVVTTGNPYSDHCLLMNRRDCLFDPAVPLPFKDQPVSEYDVADIDYGITIEGR